MTTERSIMESRDEIERLELKTDSQVVNRQARWAGLAPGHRAADIGSGSGKTTAQLYEIAGTAGEVVGIDMSADRIAYARQHYGNAGTRFVNRDFTAPLDDLGTFDFIWVRFILEYFGSTSRDILENLSAILRPGGILCLIDLDNNCLCHHGFSPRLTRTIEGVMSKVAAEADFDPYAGRKLYRHLYDMGYTDIDVQMSARHLIFGPLNTEEEFNWRKKVEVGAKQSGFSFESEYTGGYDEFVDEFDRAFSDEARFVYTQMIECRGRKPETS